MGINNIDLPASVMADLYRDTLIAGTETTVKKTPPVPAEPPQKQNEESNQPGLKWLGNNNRQILVLVNHTDLVHLPDNELEFFTGVLKACNLGLGDIALVNLNNCPGISFNSLQAALSSRIVLLFDVDPQAIELPISFPHFQLQPFAGNTFLYAPSLKELESDRVLKSKLWVCLKRLFNL